MSVSAHDLLALGLEARARFQELANGPIEVRRKPDGTAVTRVDLEIDAFLRERLTRLLPDAAWLSEESAHDADRVSRAWCWVVDPLDGTKEFARGVPECAISVGLVHDGHPRAGMVINPFSGLAAAAGSDGSWASAGETTPRPPVADLASAAATVSHTEVEDGSIVPYLGLVGTARPTGSAAYKLLRVALGVDDLTFSVQPKSEWDVCGGAALMAARGHLFERLDSRAVRFNQMNTRIPTGFVAGPAHLVRPLVEALQSALAVYSPRSAER